MLDRSVHRLTAESPVCAIPFHSTPPRVCLISPYFSARSAPRRVGLSRFLRFPIIGWLYWIDIKLMDWMSEDGISRLWLGNRLVGKAACSPPTSAIAQHCQYWQEEQMTSIKSSEGEVVWFSLLVYDIIVTWMTTKLKSTNEIDLLHEIVADEYRRFVEYVMIRVCATHRLRLDWMNGSVLLTKWI